MKKQLTLILISLLIITVCLFSACSSDPYNESIFPSDQPTDDSSANQNTQNSYEQAIRELENKLVELQQNQYISDAEYEKELGKLLQQLEALRAEAESKPDTDTQKPPETSNTPSSSPSDARFLYSVSNGKATITGYTGSESYLVIPSSIDGYEVFAIGESAFSSTSLRTVIITNGISRIDWFAFLNCTNLQSVTVPKSVQSIGYSAFNPSSDSLTIYCHSGSFAQSYAQSYGLTYAII